MGLLNKIFEVAGYIPKLKLDNENKLKESLKEQLKEAQADIKEFENLAQICLNDKEQIKKQCEDLKFKLNEYYNKNLRAFAELPELYLRILSEFIPKNTSKLEPTAKIHYKKIHNDPKGFDVFTEKIAKCEYTNGIYGGGLTKRHAQQKTEFNKIYKKNNIIVIEGVYTMDHFGKFIFIHTTAINEIEAFFVKCLFNKYYCK